MMPSARRKVGGISGVRKICALSLRFWESFRSAGAGYADPLVDDDPTKIMAWGIDSAVIRGTLPMNFDCPDQSNPRTVPIVTMRFRMSLALLVALVSLARAEVSPEKSAGDKTLVAVHHTNERPLTAGPLDGEIARMTGLILKNQHYSQKGFTEEVASKFLDRYVDTLDSLHLYFLKSDIESFEMFRTSLQAQTLRRADPVAAFVIYNRFMDRLEQQYEFVTELLKTNVWDFSGDDRYLANRKDQPRPKDPEQFRQFWRERVRFEYLQEKLNLQQPEEIAAIVKEKLAAKKSDELSAALKEKLGKEKIAEVIKQVKESPSDASPESVAKAVAAHLAKDQNDEIVKIIARRYSRIVRMWRDFDGDDVMQIYLTALCHVYDPHTDYFGRAELDNFSIGMNLSLFGIGAVLRSEDGLCKIAELMAAGPAARSGKLKPNDKIVAVAQGDGEFVDVVDMKLRKVVDLIRGPKGTRVRLKVNPADAADPSIRKAVSYTHLTLPTICSV